MPFDMPAAKLRPTGPNTTTTPPVMYSQQWSPAPSITATAPELRTANRSPTPPAAKRWPDDDLATAEPLAHVVVRLALEVQVHARQSERSETLAGAPAEAQPQWGSGSPPRAPVDARDFAGDAGPHGPVVIPDRDHARYRILPLENLGIERHEAGTNVPLHCAPPRVRLARWGGQQRREI